MYLYKAQERIIKIMPVASVKASAITRLSEPMMRAGVGDNEKKRSDD